MELLEIKQFLNQNAERVCEHLLPAGFRNGNRWTCGDVHNTPPSDKSKGGSLIVDLDGEKVGRWKDFQSSEGGSSLIDLWMAAQSVDFKTALREICQQFNLAEPERVQRKASPENKWERVDSRKRAAEQSGERQDLSWRLQPLKKDSKVWKWLTETRGIYPEILEDYRIAQYVRKDKDTGAEQHFVVFPFYNYANELELVKCRDIETKSNMFTKSAIKDAKPMLLFGQQAIFAEGSIPSEVCITEGELDALTLAGLGFNAVSVPYGAKFKKDAGDPIHADNPNNGWLEHDMEWLDVVRKFYLCLDNDESGRLATQAIFPRLGAEKCLQVIFPEKSKDANGCLLDGVDIDDLLRSARNMDPADLRRPADFEQEIWEEFYPVDGIIPGDETPWTLPFRFRPGEVSVWHGYSGGGKSVCMGYCAVYFALQGKKTCIASFEMKPRKTFKNMMRQLMGTTKPTREHFDRALSWMDQWFFVFKRVGGATIAETLALFEYTAKKYGVQHFFIDSLMRIDGVNEEEAETSKSLMNWLQAFAKRYDVHVHLVAHSRKPDSRHPAGRNPPMKHSVSGSKAITDNADNVLCVWRHEEKEEQLAAAQESGDTEKISLWEKTYDSLVLIQKCREDGFQGGKRLFYDHDRGEGSWQFREYYGDPCGVCLLPDTDTAPIY
ncbi:MAG: AAA family ATPase [Planctomycetes bacterium]|nr:AAA family ATPase [Planctomycetota bacterium]